MDSPWVDKIYSSDLRHAIEAVRMQQKCFRGGSLMKSCLFAVGCLTCLASVAIAQTVSTQILGLVTDSSGAVVSDATVTAKRPATGDVRVTKTNETGNYIFPLLDIGDYQVSCAAPGFKTEVRSGIE